jgi:hypothetical protein
MLLTTMVKTKASISLNGPVLTVGLLSYKSWPPLGNVDEKISRRSKKHDGQARKPTEIIAGSSDVNRESPK